MTNRTTYSGVLRLDDSASPSEVPVLPVQDRIPTGSWTWCISCTLVDSTDPLTPQLQHSLSNFPDETHPRTHPPTDSPVSLNRIWENDG